MCEICYCHPHNALALVGHYCLLVCKLLIKPGQLVVAVLLSNISRYFLPLDHKGLILLTTSAYTSRTCILREEFTKLIILLTLNGKNVHIPYLKWQWIPLIYDYVLPILLSPALVSPLLFPIRFSKKKEISPLIDVYPFHHTIGLFLHTLKTSESLGFLMFSGGIEREQ